MLGGLLERVPYHDGIPSVFGAYWVENRLCQLDSCVLKLPFIRLVFPTEDLLPSQMLLIPIPKGHNLPRQLLVTSREFFHFFIAVQLDLGNYPGPSLICGAAWLPQHQLHEAIFHRQATTWAFIHDSILVTQAFQPITPADYKGRYIQTQPIIGEIYT